MSDSAPCEDIANFSNTNNPDAALIQRVEAQAGWEHGIVVSARGARKSPGAPVKGRAMIRPMRYGSAARRATWQIS
jgi:hypothetical protein